VAPQPSDEHTAEHKDRDLTNNDATNLEWLTPKQQAANRKKHAARCDGKPILVFRIGRKATENKAGIKPSAEGTDWVRYESATAAGEALEVHGQALARVARYEKDPTKFKQAFLQAGGYKAMWALPDEPQTSLPSFFATVVDVEKDDNNWAFLSRIWVLEEEWKPTVGLEKKCWTSTHGRTQVKDMRCGEWGYTCVRSRLRRARRTRRCVVPISTDPCRAPSVT